MLVKGGCGHLREVVRGLAGGVQLLEQGLELVAEGVLDAGQLVGVLGAEDVPQPLGFRVAAAEAATAVEGALESRCWGAEGVLEGSAEGCCGPVRARQRCSPRGAPGGAGRSRRSPPTGTANVDGVTP